MKLAMHRSPSEVLSPFHKHKHTNRRHPNSQCHPGQNWRKESLRRSPIVVLEDHTELPKYQFLHLYFASWDRLTPQVFFTIVAHTIIWPGRCL